MKITRLIVTEKPVDTLDSDLLVYCAAQVKDQVPSCDPAVQIQVEKAHNLGDFDGKPDQSLMFYPPGNNGTKDVKSKRILVMGMGKPEPEKEMPEFLDRLRKLGGSIAKKCEKTKAAILTVRLPDIPGISAEKTAEVMAEGILLGDYRFGKYRESTRKKDDYTGLKTVRFSANQTLKAVRRGARMGRIAATAACTARDMANEPGNGWTSKEFADFARDLADTHGLTFSCLKKSDMENLRMGGILAVNQGSAIPPRMVILEYDPGKKSDTLLLVGKGITFDSGGISLKPAPGMEEMKYDMCGGAAVLSAMAAVAQEKPGLRVVAIVPATDNMSGSGAVRPGDIIRHYNKVTAEIVNTDAEGRMILGDALSYGIETYKPDCVVDVATLTGAVIIGLGHHHSGLVSNSDALSDRLIAAGLDAGEPLWRLPLNKDYKKQIESKVADIKNIGGKPGGTITAAAYLSHFVDKTPWAHLDIAGTAWDFTEKSYIPKGPSGIAVRTFINLIRSWKKWKPGN